MNYPEYVQKIIDRLSLHGESAYIVGGSVRDLLLGTSPHDYDLTTSCLPEHIAEIFSDMHVINTGLAHGTLTVVCDGKPVEITTYRIDGNYSDSRHPDKVCFTDKLAVDLGRRDFTVNAMAYNKEKGLVDLFCGREDIKARTIRAVGDASVRFDEDALRILRAFRFCAQLDFQIAPETLEAARIMAHKLKSVARERVASEFLRLIISPAAPRALTLMNETGVLEYVISGADGGLLELVGQMPCRDFARLGLLLSGHTRESASCVLDTLKASNKLRVGTLAVATHCKEHIECPADARRLLSKCGVYATDAARASELLGISTIGAYEITLAEQSKPHSLRDLDINGKDIAALGGRGKRIGEVLDAVLQLVVECPELNKRETLLSLAQQIINKEK